MFLWEHTLHLVDRLHLKKILLHLGLAPKKGTETLSSQVPFILGKMYFPLLLLFEESLLKRWAKWFMKRFYFSFLMWATISFLQCDQAHSNIFHCILTLLFNDPNNFIRCPFVCWFRRNLAIYWNYQYIL